MALDQLAQWHARAEEATADLSGRTLARLIAALMAHPLLGAAVQRNLDLLVRRGLVREVMGQGRFRVWAARV